jgi:hypothetical protein
MWLLEATRSLAIERVTPITTPSTFLILLRSRRPFGGLLGLKWPTAIL